MAIGMVFQPACLPAEGGLAGSCPGDRNHVLF